MERKPMQKFHECGNCGWSDRAEEFTWSWCNECSKAAIKGFIGAMFTLLAIGALVGLA